MKRTPCLLLALALLAACSTKNKNDEPAKLIDINSTLRVAEVWSARFDDNPKLRRGLGMQVVGEAVYVAGSKGVVAALQLQNGRRLWTRSVGVELTGGPGAGDSLVVVGSAKGEVIALEARDGRERWRVKVGAQVLTAPAVGADIVVVRTTDGKLHGLEAADGKQRWLTDQQLPRLLLRGNAPPIISADMALTPFDNGHLVAVSLGGGNTLWETTISQARGSSELQRLIDIDAAVRADGDDLFVVGYQGRVARVARETGQIIWARDLSSYRGLDIDAEHVYVSTAAGDIVKLDRSAGAEQWKQDLLKRRQLSAPAVGGGHIVVADLDGVVHWLNASDGRFVARRKVGDRVSAPPVYAGGLALVRDDEGGVHAFRPAG